jgi:transposase
MRAIAKVSVFAVVEDSGAEVVCGEFNGADDAAYPSSSRGNETNHGKIALDRWLSWARRCRILPFVHLAKRITAVRDKIHAALEHSLSNALIESVNTRIRLLTRIAFGFRSPHTLIALAMLSLAGHRPVLTGRTNPQIRQNSRKYGPAT